MPRPKKRTYTDYLYGLVEKEKRTFEELKERILRIKKLYRLYKNQLHKENPLVRP